NHVEIIEHATIQMPENAASIRCKQERHGIAHTADTVEKIIADEFEVPSDWPAIAERSFHGSCALRRALRCRTPFRPRNLRFAGLCRLFRALLPSGFHPTLHAGTSREPLACFNAAGEAVSTWLHLQFGCCSVSRLGLGPQLRSQRLLPVGHGGNLFFTQQHLAVLL